MAGGGQSHAGSGERAGAGGTAAAISFGSELTDNDRAVIREFLSETDSGSYRVIRFDNPCIETVFFAIYRNINRIVDARTVLAAAEGLHERYLTALREAVA